MGRSVSESASPSKFSYTYTEVFDKHFPYYLAMGMSYKEYWDMDSLLVRAYRKKMKLEQEMRNQHAWLQGMYIYEAMLDVAPFVKFSTKPVKPTPYRTEPFDLSGEHTEEQKKTDEQNHENKAFAYMQSYMVKHNKQYKEVMNNG